MHQLKNLNIVLIGEEAKNAHALEIAEKILNDAAWINIHTIVVRPTFHGWFIVI